MLPPEQVSGAPLAVADLTAAASELPELRSLLVSWRGTLVAEHYARGVRSTTLANVKSASKSIIAALVGIAIDRRLIKSVREPIVTYFPELRSDPDRRKQAITVEDLLTMRSGLESTSGRNYGAWVKSGNWVRYALRQPIVSEPGTAMEYSTGSSHLLSAILTKVSGTSTWQFAQTALAAPMGLRLARWPMDPQGIYFGGNEMLLTLAADGRDRTSCISTMATPTAGRSCRHRGSKPPACRARRRCGTTSGATATVGGFRRSTVGPPALPGVTAGSTSSSSAIWTSSWSPPRRRR